MTIQGTSVLQLKYYLVSAEDRVRQRSHISAYLVEVRYKTPTSAVYIPSPSDRIIHIIFCQSFSQLIRFYCHDAMHSV